MVEAILRRIWENIRSLLTAEDLPEGDLIRHWWPTISIVQPQYEALVNNFHQLQSNTYMAMLSLYMYGYAQALDDISNERIRIINVEDHTDRIPDWLWDEELERLVKTFGDKH